uniref:Secreted protein n=1 Tax=Ascaris lumbricoides TaxID=6252 RepID=A0A0M3HZ77_ASCLU
MASMTHCTSIGVVVRYVVSKMRSRVKLRLIAAITGARFDSWSREGGFSPADTGFSFCPDRFRHAEQAPCDVTTAYLDGK